MCCWNISEPKWVKCCWDISDISITNKTQMFSELRKRGNRGGRARLFDWKWQACRSEFHPNCPRLVVSLTLRRHRVWQAKWVCVYISPRANAQQKSGAKANSTDITNYSRTATNCRKSDASLFQLIVGLFVKLQRKNFKTFSTANH